MKFPQQATTVGTLGTRTACEFDVDGTAHIMSILSNMYTNARAAVLREYAANGLDSNRQAGVTDPVLVVLPTDLNPLLTISDRGLGLSRDEIVNVYARYGASTKRSTTDAIGGFGIGAKSAFTMTSQFIVEGVKDGWRSVVIFSLDNGMPGFTVASHEQTGEPNGVTIQVTTRAGEAQAWADEAARVFETWDEGTVLIDGQAPASVFTQAFQVSEHVWIAPEESEDYMLLVVVGGVGYRCDPAFAAQIVAPDEIKLKAVTSSRLILTMPIGSVDLNPNREALRDTPRTLAAIRHTVTVARRAARDRYEAEMTTAETPTDMVVVARSFRLMRDIGLWAFPYPLCAPIKVIGNTFDRFYNQTPKRDQKEALLSPLNLDTWTVIVADANGPYVKSSAALCRFVKAQAEADRTERYLIVPAGTTSVGWLDLDRGMVPVHTEAEVAAVGKLTRGSGGPTGARQINYMVLSRFYKQASTPMADILDAGLPVAYMSSHEAQFRLNDAVSLIGGLFDTYTVVVRSGNQSLAMLQKRFPSAVALADLVKKAGREATVDDTTLALALTPEWERRNAITAVTYFPAGPFRDAMEQMLSLEPLTRMEKARADALIRIHSLRHPISTAHPGSWWLATQGNVTKVRQLLGELPLTDIVISE